MSDRFVLMLAGGRGERFWPWSTHSRPKQLLPLGPQGRTLLAATMERALRLVPADHVVILTARDLVDAVAAECPGARVIGEPVVRNTAPAIAAAAQLFLAQSPGASFAVFPSDHAIDDVDAFTADVERAFTLVEREPMLLTYGIRPTHPEPNLGYIHRGVKLDERLHQVAKFVEKPDLARATEYVKSGEYAWNAGIFTWGARTFMDALERSRPAIAAPMRALKWTGGDAGFSRALDDVFPAIDGISVDYAVLEHAPNVVTIEASFDWDDLGSWSAWARRQPRDARGNVVFGDAVPVNCDRCVLVGEGGIAAAVGLSDMVVVHVGGSTLCCRLEEADQVRRVSEAVRARNAR